MAGGYQPHCPCGFCWGAGITHALHRGYLWAASIQRCLESLVMGSLPLWEGGSPVASFITLLLPHQHRRDLLPGAGSGLFGVG